MDHSSAVRNSLNDFEHLTSSPGNSKANGKAEAAVKVAKDLIRKTIKTKGNLNMALLDHRNTPTSGHDTNAAERFFNRRTRTLLPMTNKLLTQQHNSYETTRNAIQQQQKKQQGYFTRHAHDLPILQQGQSVRIQPFVNNKKVWKKGTVLRKLDSRSDEIEADNTIYHRNHVHLKKVDEPITPAQITQLVLPCEPIVEKRTPQQPAPVAPVSHVKPMELRRSEREIRRPQRLIMQ